MLSAAQNTFIAIAIVALSLCFLMVLNRVWPPGARRRHNDIVGWQVTVVGTTYAVIIGFMLYAVWTEFGVARANTDAEANALVNVSRLADGLPQAQRERIQLISSNYADAMIREEWPAMLRGASSSASNVYTLELWSAALHPQNLTAFESMTLDHLISELTAMTEHRRLRQLESRTGLPGILWAVLTVGAIITIASSCLFGTQSFLLHLLQVLGLSILVAMSLIAIAEIDRPFQGSVHVTPEAFIRAQKAFQAAKSPAP